MGQKMLGLESDDARILRSVKLSHNTPQILQFKPLQSHNNQNLCYTLHNLYLRSHHPQILPHQHRPTILYRPHHLPTSHPTSFPSSLSNHSSPRSPGPTLILAKKSTKCGNPTKATSNPSPSRVATAPSNTIQRPSPRYTKIDCQ